MCHYCWCPRRCDCHQFHKSTIITSFTRSAARLKAVQLTKMFTYWERRRLSQHLCIPAVRLGNQPMAKNGHLRGNRPCNPSLIKTECTEGLNTEKYFFCLVMVFWPPAIYFKQAHRLHGRLQKLFPLEATSTLSGFWRCNANVGSRNAFTVSTRLHQKENRPCYDGSHKKCASLEAIARYITIIFTIGHLQIFKTRYFHRSIAIVFNETTNYDSILHSKTRAANIWDLVQSDQSPFLIKPCLSLLIFHLERSSYINRTSRPVYVGTTIGQLTKVRIPCRL